MRAEPAIDRVADGDRRVIFDPRLQLADHAREVRYEMSPPPGIGAARPNAKSLYVYGPGGRRSRVIDDAMESFVDNTRMGTG
jgi:hypothetical protein